MWLSLLDYLKSKSLETEVVFINGNKNDFYADEHDIKFHPDLLKDLEAMPNLRMRPFLSLAAFVDAEIDKEEHAIDRAKTAPIFEHYLEEQALELFESADPAFLRELEKACLPGSRLFDHATGVSASLMEGVEDFDITATSDVGGNDVYVSCLHDLRIVIFEITIPDTDYKLHKNSIRANHAFYEVEEMDRAVLLRTSARVYLSVSFTLTGDQRNAQATVQLSGVLNRLLRIRLDGTVAEARLLCPGAATRLAENQTLTCGCYGFNWNFKKMVNQTLVPPWNAHEHPDYDRILSSGGTQVLDRLRQATSKERLAFVLDPREIHRSLYKALTPVGLV